MLTLGKWLFQRIHHRFGRYFVVNINALIIYIWGNKDCILDVPRDYIHLVPSFEFGHIKMLGFEIGLFIDVGLKVVPDSLSIIATCFDLWLKLLLILSVCFFSVWFLILLFLHSHLFYSFKFHVLNLSMQRLIIDSKLLY